MPTAFARWLQGELDRRGIDGPAAAGRATGVPQSQISRYLNGQHHPSRRTLRRFADWAGAPLEELWALVPLEAPVGAPGPVRLPAPGDLPAEVRAVRADIAALRAEFAAMREGALRPTGPLVAFPPGGTHAIDRPSQRGINDRVISNDADDLLIHDPPIPRGTLVWVEHDRRPEVGKVVAADAGGTVFLRVLAPDGVTLASAVPSAVPLRLDAVDRVVGVGHLVQMPI